MSPPIRDGSGDSIGSIRLGDGTEISEVRTGAGDVVFSASASAPDSKNLHAEFDAIKESASSGTLTSITDHSGGFGSLSGSVTYQNSALNSSPAFVFYPSNNDILDSTSLNSNLSAPQTVYFVYRLDNTNSSANCVGFGRGSGSVAELAYRTRLGGIDNDAIEDASSDAFYPGYPTDIQTPHISAFVLDSNAVIERDDKSAESFSGFTTGSYQEFTIGPDTQGFLWEGPISACLVYAAAHSQSTRDEVFSYLSSRFGFS